MKSKIVCNMFFNLFLSSVLAFNYTVTEKPITTTSNLPKAKICNWPSAQCFLHCSDTTQYLLNKEIEKAMEDQSHPQCFILGMRFKFTEIVFFNSTLSNKWFKVDDIPLIEMELTSNIIEHIGNNAFGTYHFKDLKILTLRDLPVKQLIADTFTGLNSLQQLIMENMPIDQIEENLLSTISKSIASLEIHSFKEINLKNLTGCCTELRNLTKLTITKTLIKIIEIDSLSQLSIMNHLNITNCKLQSIAINAFDCISKTILTIDLRENQLTTIDINVFKFIAETQSPELMKIFIDENPWNCDLIANEVLEFINENLEIFNYVEICLSSSSSLETTTETSTTPKPPNFGFVDNLNIWILVLIFIGICSLNVIFCCFLHYKK